MLQLDCLCLYGAFVLTCIFVSARLGFRYVPWRLSGNGVIAVVGGLGANLLQKKKFVFVGLLSLRRWWFGLERIQLLRDIGLDLSGSSCSVTSASACCSAALSVIGLARISQLFQRFSILFLQLALSLVVSIDPPLHFLLSKHEWVPSRVYLCYNSSEPSPSFYI